MQGKVIKYNASRGFGFISCDKLKDDIFVHIKNVTNARNLKVGQKVTFEVENTPKGLAAISVKAAGGTKTLFTVLVVLSLLVIAVLFAVAYKAGSVGVLPMYLAIINVFTFLMYGYDKAVAGTGKSRIPEARLHFFAMIGGSPAGLVAQKFFRHKTVKGSFQFAYWAIVVLQIGLLWFYFNDQQKFIDFVNLVWSYVS